MAVCCCVGGKSDVHTEICGHLMWPMLVYCVINLVSCICVCFVHMQSLFTESIYVEFL
jgi:hypothetical protein